MAMIGGGIMMSILTIIHLLFFLKSPVPCSIITILIICCVIFICYFSVCVYKCVFEKEETEQKNG